MARLGRSLLSRAPKCLPGCTLVASHSAVATMENAMRARLQRAETALEKFHKNSSPPTARS